MSKNPTWRDLDQTLHGFFRGRVRDPSLRDDLVQEVLLRMHERREQLQDDDRLEAWMYRIARNTLSDHFRRARPSEALPELAVEAQPDQDPALEISRAHQLLGAYLHGRISALPSAQREVLELTELEGLSQREVAQRLGVPYSTVKSRVQRGRDRLHADLLRCCALDLDARGQVQGFEPRDCNPDCNC